MALPNNHRAAHYIKYALIILGVVLIISCVFLVREYRSLRYEQLINARELRLSNLLARRGPLTENDIIIISPWMTFDYVNKIFALPPGYLKTQLSISDTRYPSLSLSTYARNQNIDRSTFVLKLDDAVRAYFLKNSSST